MAETNGVKPNPRTYTLRFKHNTTTILLEVDPLYSFASIRAELLLALQETNPSGTLSGQPIPQNPDDILLGQAVDRNDLNLGYTTIGKDDADADASTSGKGKGKSGTASKGPAQLNDCPQGAGLRNADVVAFKFKSGTNQSDQAEGEVLVEEWDVVVPSMEETYGDGVEERDEGIGMEDD